MAKPSHWHTLIEKHPPELVAVEIQTRDGIRRGRFDPLEWHYGWVLLGGQQGQTTRCPWADGQRWRPLSPAQA